MRRPTNALNRTDQVFFVNVVGEDDDGDGCRDAQPPRP